VAGNPIYQNLSTADEQLTSLPKKLLGSRSIGSAIRLLVAVFLCLPVLFTGLSVLAATVPNESIVAALRDDVWWGRFPTEPRLTNGFGGRFDGTTDCVLATIGLGAPEMSPWQQAINSPTLGNCIEALENLQEVNAGRPAGWNYFRYWNGGSVLWRPVMAAWGMNGVRAIGAGAVGIAVLALAVQMSQLFSSYPWPAFDSETRPWRKTLFPLIVTVALLGPLLLSSDLLIVANGAGHHALILGIALFGGAAAAWAGTRGFLVSMVTALVAGSVFNFIDNLTVPPLSWMLVACLTGIGAMFTQFTDSQRKPPPKTTIPFIISLGAAAMWAFGYAATWVMKWLLAAITIGFDTVRSDVADVVGFRLQGEWGEMSTAFGNAITANIREWLAFPLSVPVLIVALLSIVSMLLLAFRRIGIRSIQYAAVLGWPLLLLPIWYETLSNHSQIHVWFTYRSIPMAIGLALTVSLAVLTLSHRSPSPSAFGLDDDVAPHHKMPTPPARHLASSLEKPNE